jgi:hypothetical protein
MLPQHLNILLKNKHDSFLQNPHALERFRQKLISLEQGNNEIIDIAIAGDSITDGYNAGDTTATLMANGYTYLLSSKFAERYGESVGRGYIPTQHPYGKSYIAKTGTWNENGYNVVKNGYNVSTQGATLSFNFNGTGVELWTMKIGSAGTISVSIDGGEAVNYNLQQGTAVFPYVINITGLEDGEHTCLITNTEAKYFNFAGFKEIKGNKGIRIHHCSRSGADSTYLNWTDARPYWSQLNPDLTIVAIGVNDFGNQTNLTTFKNNLQGFITNIGAYSDIIITTLGPSDQSGTIPYSSYVDGIRDVVKLNSSVAFLDFDAIWGGCANARTMGYYPTGTNIHPNGVGHQEIALKLYDAITSVLRRS